MCEHKREDKCLLTQLQLTKGNLTEIEGRRYTAFTHILAFAGAMLGGLAFVKDTSWLGYYGILMIAATWLVGRRILHVQRQEYSAIWRHRCEIVWILKYFLLQDPAEVPKPESEANPLTKPTAAKEEKAANARLQGYLHPRDHDGKLPPHPLYVTWTADPEDPLKPLPLRPWRDLIVPRFLRSSIWGEEPQSSTDTLACATTAILSVLYLVGFFCVCGWLYSCVIGWLYGGAGSHLHNVEVIVTWK